MQQGQPEDWRGYNNPPKVRWWMQTASTGVNIALDYLCPDADTRLASDFSSHFCYTNVGTASTPLSRLHTYTSAECGNDPPPHNGRDCLAVFAMRSQSGRDKQWEVLQRDKATTFRWQCPGCTARINVKVHYLCPKLTHRDMSPWKIYRCYHHFWNAGTGWIQHTWTAGDCEGHLPSSGAKCFSGYRAGFYQGTSENMKVYDKEEGFYFEWECNDCTGSARVAADYVCYEP